MTSPTPYQLLPRLTDDEYEALKADIAENGVRVPIDVDEDGVILDGHHRAWITADLGVECPRRTVAGLDEQGKRDHARSVNALRRHLTATQRREQVAQMRSEGISYRDIGRTLGVSKSIVHRDMQRVSTSGHPEKAAPEDPADPFAGDDWTEPTTEETPQEEVPAMPRPRPSDTAAPKTIGPAVANRAGRLVPQRSQHDAVANAIATLNGLCAGLDSVGDIDKSLDAEEVTRWTRDLSKAARIIRRLNIKLKEQYPC